MIDNLFIFSQLRWDYHDFPVSRDFSFEIFEISPLEKRREPSALLTFSLPRMLRNVRKKNAQFIYIYISKKKCS